MRPRTLIGPLVASLVLATGLAGSSADTVPLQKSSSGVNPNPVNSSAGVKNVTFYYNGGGNVPLDTAHVSQLRTRLGTPAVVVTTPKADDQDSIAAIHRIGAKAYRYVQFFWAPKSGVYEGIDLATHPDWAFCSSGATKAVGRYTRGADGSSMPWYFLDTNEVAVRQAIRAQLQSLADAGWDGVFFDRGEAATQYAADVHGHPVWYQKSSCTGTPASPGARLSDAYVHLLSLAHSVRGAGAAARLHVMMNNGKSPFDSVTPMRPNPRDADCRARRWSRCSHLADAWPSLNLVLNETAVRPRDVSWARTFAANQASERNRTHGHRTVAMITTATLGGRTNARSKAKVFYAWSRIKLFNIAVAVNTGDGGCAGVAGICNRYGVYPQLTNTRFGKPRGARPVAQSCIRKSKVHCVWLRRYAQGVNVLNASGRSRSSARVALGTATCRHVYDVYAGAPLARNRCVKVVRIRLPAWSGRPLRYSSKRW